MRGWDQRRLADTAGVSQATVSRAMAGRHVHRSALVRLVRALHEHKPIAELRELVDVEDAA